MVSDGSQPQREVTDNHNGRLNATAPSGSV